MHILEHGQDPTNVNLYSFLLLPYTLTHLFTIFLGLAVILCSSEEETEQLLDHEVLAEFQPSRLWLWISPCLTLPSTLVPSGQKGLPRRKLPFTPRFLFSFQHCVKIKQNALNRA